MPDAYLQLLDATIQHLQELKARGVRHVPVSRETLTGLAQRPAIPGPPLARGRATGPPVPEPETSTLALPLQTRSRPAAPGGFAPEPATKVAAMADLRARALVCVKCPHLAASRQNVVFGVGDIDAALLFVGEAPGADEDVQGEPFVGAAGQLLTKIINTMGLSRQTVYIANILKCRPNTPGQNSGNRKPTSEEMKTCLPYLQAQLDLIQPKVIVALGGTAVEALLGSPAKITRLRGQWQTYRNIPLMPTFHPSYLLRNAALAEKRKVWEDMLQVMERLGLPINAKQKNFFLRA